MQIARDDSELEKSLGLRDMVAELVLDHEDRHADERLILRGSLEPRSRMGMCRGISSVNFQCFRFKGEDTVMLWLTLAREHARDAADV